MAYWIIFRTGLSQSAAMRGGAVGRFAFYGIILLIFSRLWEVVLTRGGLEGINPRDMIWYIAATEWIVLSLPELHMDIDKEVQSGDLAYLLPRPVNYAVSKFFEGLGALVVRLGILSIAGGLFGYLAAGGWPSDPKSFIQVIPMGLMASIVALLFVCLVGLSSFWLQDSSPVFWVWQKALFVLGGLILPLTIYPDWLRNFAVWTPFPAILFFPCSLILPNNGTSLTTVFFVLLFWGSVAVLLIALLYRLGVRQVNIHGG